MFLIKGGIIIKPFNILTISKLCSGKVPDWSRILKDIKNTVQYGSKWKTPFIYGVKKYINGTSKEEVKNYINSMNHKPDVLKANVDSFDYFLEFLKLTNIDKNNLYFKNMTYKEDNNLVIVAKNILIDKESNRMFLLNNTKSKLKDDQIDFLLSFIIKNSIENEYKPKDIFYVDLKDSKGNMNIELENRKNYKRAFNGVIKTAKFFKEQIEVHNKAELYDQYYSEYDEDSDEESAVSF